MSASKEGDFSNNIPPYSSGMTPSIIKTINNTSPTLPDNHSIIYNNVNANSKSKARQTSEPYESYIEDSFVGHWEREDDDEVDPNDQHRAHHGAGGAGEADENESELHPSTIEFDFDSFGPESFIYTPTANTTAIATTKPTSVTPTQSPVIESSDSKSVGASTPVQQLNSLVEEKEVEQQEKPAQAKPIISQSGERQQQQNAISGDQRARSPQISTTTAPRALSYTIVDDYLVDPTKIDLKVIEPYKKVISHAGYCHHFDPSATAPNPGEPAPAIIVFSACYLPDRSRRDYNYVMDHLFLYVLSSLHELIADDYILIYLHNAQPSSSAANGGSVNVSSTSVYSDESHPQNNLPTFSWMKRCYQMIDRKLRKNLKILYLVKPTFWLKTIIIMCKPFISAKFSKKLRFVEDMAGLKKCLPVDKLILPASAHNI